VRLLSWGISQGVRVKDQWYCGVDGQQYGPYTWDQLRAMAAEGRIVPETYVRREIDQQWLSAAQIPGLLARKKTKKPASASASHSDSGAFAGATAAPTTTVTSAATVTPGVAKPAGTMSATKKLKAAKPISPAPASPKVAAVPAVGAAAAVPAGQAVGAVPVGQPVSPAAPPVGVPMGFAINTAPTPRVSQGADDDELPRKKKGSPLILVGVLGGVVLAIAIVGVAAVAWNWSQPAADGEGELTSAEEASTNDTDPAPAEGNPGEVAEGNPSGETNPGAASGAVATEKAGEKGDESAGGKLPPKTVAAAQKVIASQGKWSDLLRHKEIKINNVSLSVLSVWLASDLAGTRVDPQVPAGDASAKSAAGESSAAQSSVAGKYVFVEVRIANAAPVPRKYNSWNAAGATAVILASDAGDILAPVSPSSTPGVKRQATVQVQPGQSVFDVLVFEAPAKPFESLKLALAKSAVVDTAKGHWAFAVPLEAMFRKRPDLASSPAAGEGAGGGPISANQAPQATDDPVLTPPATAAADKPVEAPAPEKPKINRPPTKEELNKQFEEFDKTPPADAGKEPAKAPPKP
jgi:hypothetical protein